MHHPGVIRTRPVVALVMLLALSVAMLTVIPQGVQTVACCIYRLCHAVENYLLLRICPSLNNGPDWGTVDFSSLGHGLSDRIMG